MADTRPQGLGHRPARHLLSMPTPFKVSRIEADGLPPTHTPSKPPHTSDPRENISLSLFWVRDSTLKRGFGVPVTFPLPPKFWVPHLLWVRFPGSQESPAHLDTQDWLSYGDLREAQSWARPAVSTHRETGGVRCASPGPCTSAPTPNFWRQEESGNLGNNVQVLGNWAWDGQGARGATW